jgi:hypothetical protein
MFWLYIKPPLKSGLVKKENILLFSLILKKNNLKQSLTKQITLEKKIFYYACFNAIN